MFLRIVLMLAMVGALGAVGFVLLSNNPQTSSAEAAAAPFTGKSVLVAARNLTPGTLLREADVRWEGWALSDVPDGYLMRGRDKEDAGLGSVVRRSFVAGEPLLSGQMVAPGERGFLAAVLTPGMRAVAVGGRCRECRKRPDLARRSRRSHPDAEPWQWRCRPSQSRWRDVPPRHPGAVDRPAAR